MPQILALHVLFQVFVMSIAFVELYPYDVFSFYEASFFAFLPTIFFLFVLILVCCYQVLVNIFSGKQWWGASAD